MCLILNTIQPELKMVGFKSIKNYYSCVDNILYYLVIVIKLIAKGSIPLLARPLFK